MRVLGMISGTSMDGIDVAVADLELRDQAIELHPLGSTSNPYDDGLRRDLEATLPPASTTTEMVCRLDAVVGQAFAAAALDHMAGISPAPELIVSHGQTVYHWVDGDRVRGTLQIGQPAWIAEATGLPVIADLRSADVAAGGQGAPLAALFDALLLSESEGISASLNLGGIANVTVVDPSKGAFAYDTGPANALIDAAVADLTDGEETFDRDGRLARGGSIHRPLVDALLSEPYYRQPRPKTTGKELFNSAYLSRALADFGKIDPEDLVASLTAVTAITVADACRAAGVVDLVVAGGGADNPVLMEMLGAEMPEVSIRRLDEMGVPTSTKEAYFIAMIGFLTWHGLPGNLPSATGAARPAVLGSIVPGPGGLELPSPAVRPPSRLRIIGEEPV